MIVSQAEVLQGAKAQLFFQHFAARLKSGPDYKATSFRGSKPRCRPRMTVSKCRFRSFDHLLYHPAPKAQRLFDHH
jgi:hypothetical protein